jgi:hypothetical protein
VLAKVEANLTEPRPLVGSTMEERPTKPTAPQEPAKWPLRRTFGFLLVLGGVFWIGVGLVLKLLIS